jgi:gamma-glutamyltranspeptidase
MKPPHHYNVFGCLHFFEVLGCILLLLQLELDDFQNFPRKPSITPFNRFGRLFSSMVMAILLHSGYLVMAVLGERDFE